MTVDSLSTNLDHPIPCTTLLGLILPNIMHGRLIPTMYCRAPCQPLSKPWHLLRDSLFPSEIRGKLSSDPCGARICSDSPSSHVGVDKGSLFSRRWTPQPARLDPCKPAMSWSLLGEIPKHVGSPFGVAASITTVIWDASLSHTYADQQEKRGRGIVSTGHAIGYSCTTYQPATA